MKKRLDLLALLAVMSLAAVLTGCGSDDDDDDGNGVAPPQLSPASASGRQVTITQAGQPARTFHFNVDGSSVTIVEGDQQTTGTFQYTKTGAATARIVATIDGQTSTYDLVFANATSGTFTVTGPDGATSTGTFANFIVTDPATPGPGPGPGPGDGPGPGEGPGPGPGPDGTAPASLANRVFVADFAAPDVVFGRTTYNIGAGGNTFTASNEGSGNVVYTPSGSTANLRFNYTAPPQFVGDFDDLNLVFTAQNAGTFTGQIRIGESVQPTNGTFTIE